MRKTVIDDNNQLTVDNIIEDKDRGSAAGLYTLNDIADAMNSNPKFFNALVHKTASLSDSVMDINIQMEPRVPTHLVTWVIDKTNDATVKATFTCATTGIIHTRNINTFDCIDHNAVDTRLAEVANGIHNKISAGVITAPDIEGNLSD